MGKKYKVLIMKCDEYDAQKIGSIIKDGMLELGVRPHGKILLKPNAVLSHPEIFPHACTRKEFLDGALYATKETGENIKEISVGERSGLSIATRFSFKNAGYAGVIKKHKVKTYYFDEEKQIPFQLKKEGRLRDTMFFPKPIVESDFLINLPKFKAHPWTRLTLSLKNFIGIQDDRHRLVDHNSFLENKIADLQEVIQPGFIAIDAIIAGQKMMLTPTPFPMGAIVMGTNSCAVDTVGCHMVNVKPPDLIHLKLASERGYGPMDISEIDVTGDFPLKDVRKKTKGFQFCLEHIDDYFNGKSNLTCAVGSFPEKHSKDYCWGGCPGALQETMHIFRGFFPGVDRDMKKVRYVVGDYKGKLDLDDDERVLFVGNCTAWEGEIDGKKVKIESSYRTSTEVDEKKTKSNDMLKRIGIALLKTFINRKSRYIHVKGCTVSAVDHVNYLSALSKITNPNFDYRLFMPVTIAYCQMRIHRLINKIFR